MRTWVDVDVSAIRENARALRAYLGGVRLIAVVKADAYGHGAAEVVASLGDEADAFAVATAEEALDLRAVGVTRPVLILQPLTPGSIESALMAEAEITIDGVEQLKRVEAAAGRRSVDVRVHVEVQTGMNRSGVDPSDLRELVERCRSSVRLRVVGLWTHFANADDPADAFTLEQFARFIRATDPHVDRSTVRHAANTGAALNFPQTALDGARIGIGLYGVFPSPAATRSVTLRPALSWHAKVLHTQGLAAGESVSYGRRFTATTDMRIASLAVGYGDGYPRRASGRAQVLLRGQRCAILGNVCMDSLICDVTHVPDVRYGETATLIGTDGAETITASEVAEWSDEIVYQVLTWIGRRVVRCHSE